MLLAPPFADNRNNTSTFDPLGSTSMYTPICKLPNMVIWKSLRVPRDWVTSAQNQCVVCGFSLSYCWLNSLWIDDYYRGVSRDYRAVHHFTRGQRARLSPSTEWGKAAYHLGNHGLPARVFLRPPDQFASLVASESRLISTRLFFVEQPKTSNIPVASDNHHRIERENNAGNLQNYASPYSNGISEFCKAVQMMHSGRQWSFSAPFVTFFSVFFCSYHFKYILVI